MIVNSVVCIAVVEKSFTFPVKNFSLSEEFFAKDLARHVDREADEAHEATK